MKRALETRVIQRGYDRKTCWVHARCGFVRPGEPEETIVVTMQECEMSSRIDAWDLFSGLHSMYSQDGGVTWSAITEQPGLAPWMEQGDIQVVVSDFTPQWHRKTGTLLGIGHTCRYRGNQLLPAPRPRETAWSVYNRETHEWSPAQLLKMEDRERFTSSGAGSVQWWEKENGELLLPTYYRSKKESTTPSLMAHPSTKVTVLRCQFDGKNLTVLEAGNELAVPEYRGLGEPSLVEVGGQFWITLRNGNRSYYAVSSDGLNFTDPQPWRFDNGADLGSYDTQQHWATIDGRLYLFYTRKGLDNDHVIRHRAPLLMAEVDQQKGCVLRDSEQIVVPNRGALLANFGVSQRTPDEAWVCVSEWMENAFPDNKPVWTALRKRYPDADLEALAKTPGRCGTCELGGSDNSVFLVKIR